MNLIEILKAKGINDELIQAIQEDMKANSIFTASEENLDIRYGKLKTQHDGVNQQLTEANNLIEELKKSNKGNEGLQQKVTAYEQQVAQLNQQLFDEKWRNRARFGLMQAGADDIDYVLYKLEESMTKEGKERKLNDAEEIEGWEDLLKGMQTQLPQRFAKSDDDDDEYQIVNPLKLKKGDDGELTVTREKFAGMTYEERMALKKQNEKAYNSMVK